MARIHVEKDDGSTLDWIVTDEQIDAVIPVVLGVRPNETMTDQPHGHLHIQDMTWPDPRDPRELEWRLRYAPDTITRRDQLTVASIVHAYNYLIHLDARTRQKRVMQIREAADDA